MNEDDRRHIIDRYRRYLAEFGPSSRALGWGRDDKQSIRFDTIVAPIVAAGGSVLDVGCGFADLYGHLRSRGWNGRYAGIDLVPEFVAEAKRRHPDTDLRIGDISSVPDTFDFVVGYGIFNTRLPGQANADYIAQTLQDLLRRARVAVCVDFLSSACDYQDPSAWHTNPAWAIEQALQLSPRVRLSHEYLPFEFALVVFADREFEPSRRTYQRRYGVT